MQKQSLPKPADFDHTSIPFLDVVVLLKTHQDQIQNTRSVYKKMEKLILEHYTPLTQPPFVVDDTFGLCGSRPYVNPCYLTKKVNAVAEISFCHFYPSIILRAWCEGTLQFESATIGYAFCTLFKYMGRLLQDFPELSATLRTHINRFYVLLSSGTLKAAITVPIPIIAHEVMSGFLKRFPKHTVCHDTDTLFVFPETLEMYNDMKDYLRLTGYEFSTKDYDAILCIDIKKHILFDGGVVKCRGIIEMNG
jgi:hypothetical protein